MGLTQLAMIAVALLFQREGRDGHLVLLLVAAPGLFFAAAVARIAVHEFAHALVAKGLGCCVSIVSIGSGPIAASKTFGLCEVRLRRYPMGGVTHYHLPGAAWTRTRIALVASAGPLADASLCAAVLVLWPSGGPLSGALRTMAALNLAVDCLIGAFPRRNSGWADTTVLGNDGFVVLYALRANRDTFRMEADELRLEHLRLRACRGQAGQVADELTRKVANRPGDREAANVLMLSQLFAERWEDARTTAARVLDGPNDDVNRQVFVNAALAYAMAGGPGDLAVADRLSAEAMEEVGWSGSAQGVRSLVLAALRRDEEAGVLARRSIGRLDKPSDRAWSHVILSELADRAGDARKARLHHRLAFRIDAGTPLLEPGLRRRTFGPTRDELRTG
jgi:hypothetical protein